MKEVTGSVAEFVHLWGIRKSIKNTSKETAITIQIFDNIL